MSWSNIDEADTATAEWIASRSGVWVHAQRRDGEANESRLQNQRG